MTFNDERKIKFVVEKEYDVEDIDEKKIIGKGENSGDADVRKPIDIIESEGRGSIQ